MKEKTHIAEGLCFEKGKTLCGRDKHKVLLFSVETIAKLPITNVTWCKVCKMLYNANHSEGKYLK